ncbi:AsmA-like C-terminal region-containing protein [uncultured Flavobacterium sp.]|uniref:AsmA-like C-terminal region-containing protein n=1 Tax=uncultured Flavobacterium sp. TaxID=165435 RepID=UPI0030EBB55F|tara:strand:+ start:59517 stop:62123 length:2607 start_codon:yes stop_codon:yes gene_type:complete
MLKKILKITGITLLVVIIGLVAAPFIFKDKIKEMIAKTLNESVDAKVAFEDVDLSLLKSFPLANVSIDKLSIINKAPFEGDTLFYSGETNLKMSIKELFKDASETINLESISAENAIVNIIFNKDGIGNFDIALKDDQPETESDSKPFALNIQDYKVENLRFTYLDQGSDMKMVLDSINHSGTGNFAAQKLDLDTKTTAKLSFEMEKNKYMNNVAVTLDAVLGIDMDKMKFDFKDNKALINQLPLEFNGFLQMVDDGQLYDLTFKTPTSSFKNFLGLVPEAYSGDLDKVQTSGDFTVNGKVNGKLTETTIPKFNIKIASINAMFKYPDLPKAVKNIVIDTDIVNETGLMNDTYVNLDKLSFSIDQDVFNVKANIRNFENALVNAELKGTINLANVTKAYPVQLDMPLSGILKADVVTKFDMKSVETSQYQNIQNSGNMSITGFNYEGPELAKPFRINKAAIVFNTSKIQLNEFDAKTGSSDLKITGALDNFYGFMFKNQVLKGNFNMNSNNLMVSDFMEPTTTTTTEGKKATEAVKIPSFLDCSITAKANNVVYDNLILKDVSGNLVIKDEAIALNNLKMAIFGGNIGMNGTVSTKGKIPTFNMDLGLNQVNIAESFTQLDMLNKIAPIAGVINGKLNSTIKLSGNLTNEMTPDLKTLSGDLIGQLLSTTINEKNSKLLSTLTSNLSFINLDKLNLNDVKAALSFSDGKVNLKPLDIKYQDIKLTVGGTHGFDQVMNYDLKFDIPTKYLGTEVNNLITKLTPADAKKMESIPINGLMTGSFAAPKFTTDLKVATTNLVTQLVKQQKDKYINQGLSQLGNAAGLPTKTDSTGTIVPKTKEEVKEEVKEVVKDKVKDKLKDLFNKKKKDE